MVNILIYFMNQDLDFLDFPANCQFSCCQNLPDWLRRVECECSLGFVIFHLNIRSIRKNWDNFIASVGIMIKDCDLIVLSEINISECECPLYCLERFDMFSFCKKGSSNGGVMVLVRTEMRAKQVCNKMLSCESLKVRIKLENKTMDVISVYRHPNDDRDAFLSEIEETIKLSENNEIALIGDMNIDLMQDSNNVVNKYVTLLNKYS